MNCDDKQQELGSNKIENVCYERITSAVSKILRSLGIYYCMDYFN